MPGEPTEFCSIDLASDATDGRDIVQPSPNAIIVNINHRGSELEPAHSGGRVTSFSTGTMRQGEPVPAFALEPRNTPRLYAGGSVPMSVPPNRDNMD